MNTSATVLLLLSVIACACAQGCIPSWSYRQNEWFNGGNNIYYTHTKLNVRWDEADRKCRDILPGRYSRLATIRSTDEWRRIKAKVTPNWYWFDNRVVTNIESNIRYFHFDRTTRLYRRVARDSNCLVFVWPGDSTTDLYCGSTWARALCEVRCN